MSTTDQQNTKRQETKKVSTSRNDESFQQDHLDAKQEQEYSSELQSPPSLFKEGLADALQREEHWKQVQFKEDPNRTKEELNRDQQQLEWAISLANSLLGLGIDLGLNDQSAPPQMSPREIAVKLQQALQHPDKDLRSAASSVIQAMNIPISEALSTEGIDRICNHLSSM